MIRAFQSIAFAALFLICIPQASRAADAVKTLDIGASAPDFSLPGVDGKTHSLGEYSGSKLLCILFTCNHCPTAQAYEDRVLELYKNYHDKGVALVAINPNNPAAIRLDELRYSDLSDSLDDMKIRAKVRGFEFPYLYDGETQVTSHAYGVQATPHVFLFDAQRKLRYVGAIDDSDVKTVTKHYLRDAIDALLAGKAPPVEKSRVFGCSTKWIDKTDSAKKQIDKWNQEPVDLKEIDVNGVKALAANDTKNLRLVNVWATWCGPCTAELPDLVAIERTYRSRPFEQISICLDDVADKKESLKVLTQVHLTAANYIYKSDDKDALAVALDKEWPGPLPYTVLIAPGGKIIYRHGAGIDGLELRKAIVDYMGRTYASLNPPTTAPASK